MPLTVEDMNIFQVKSDIKANNAVKADRLERNKKIAQKMLKDGLGLDTIARYVDLRLEELKKLLKM